MDSPLRRRRGLSGPIGLAAFAACALSIAPAGAQQVIAGKGSVTIDLGVLNQLGPPVTGGYAPSGQATAYPQTIYGQPAYGQPYGGLQFPPQQYPVSTLTVQPPAGSVPYVAPASMPAAPAATASTAGTPPPPPTMAPTTVPMTTATTTTGTETTTGVATTTEPATDTTSSTTPAVPLPTPLATTDTGGTATTTATTGTTATTETTTAGGTTATTDTSAAAATQPAAPAATGTESGTAATGATTAATTGATGQTQTASIPPAAVSEGQVRIAFPADSAEIPDAVKAQLDALAQKMASDDNMRVQLLAYASGTPETASRARRMSLSRALAVRSYLIKQGVRSTRMDVRALGNNVEGSPADRVDIIPKAQ